jgi:hypothetical protein
MNSKKYFTQKTSHMKGKLRMYKITSRFQQQESFRSQGHSGIDFAMPNHTPLRSIQDGIVEKVTHYQDNIGNGVLVRWNDGKVAIYGHMSETSVNVGDKVHAGDLLGYSGNSGHVVGANGGYHLHFGLKENGHFTDPSPYIENIQNMNTTIIQHAPDIKLNFFDYMSQHMNAISDLKIHLIHLPYDTLLFQIGKQLLQFISIHSSFLNHIIACIF